VGAVQVGVNDFNLLNLSGEKVVRLEKLYHCQKKKGKNGSLLQNEGNHITKVSILSKITDYSQ
jgi:hypothetical protein